MIRRLAPVPALLVPALALALLLVLGACGADPARYRWQLDGEQVDQERMYAHQGEEHCDWEDVTFLRLDWPLDDPAPDQRRLYVWDPKDVLGDRTLAGSTDDADLPDDAESTGYSSELGELWLAPSDQDTVAYLVSEDGDEVEAWARTDRIIGCD